MKERVAVLFALLFTLGLAGTTPAAAVTAAPGAPMGVPLPPGIAPTASAFVPGQLLVEFRATETLQEMRATAGAAGASVLPGFKAMSTLSGNRLVLVKSATMTTADLTASFAGEPTVVRTSPNYLRRVAAAVPDDPGLIDQWGLFKVGALQAWERSAGAPEVVVASIDTGVDFLHPDLAENMWHNPGEVPGNDIDDDGNGYVDDVYGIDAVDHDAVPVDPDGHGTHTSGIIAGVADNATGVAGIGGHTRIMALRFIGIDGWGTDADAITCIDYAVNEKLEHGVNVVAINASWGWFDRNPFLRDAIARAGDAGIVFCAAAGNQRHDNDTWPLYPSSYACSNIIAVAASGTDDRLAWFSNWGARRVDLAAPGEAILSTLPTVVMLPNWFGGECMYGAWSGTSMAAPFVAGTVALLAATRPDDTLSERVQRILETAHPVFALRGRCTTGGRLDAAAALGLGAVSGDLVPPQTSVLGRDDLWHGIPVRLRLVATDGPDGSGVAYKAWRLDGGPWQRGATPLVPAPPAVTATHVVEFRSTDRAGNIEAAQSCTVMIDTTAPTAGEIPGVPLPASPVFADLEGGPSSHHVYSLALAAGESLRATVARVPGMRASLRLYPPGTVALGWIPPAVVSWEVAEGPTLAYCAEETGTYYLDLRVLAGSSGYRLDWEVFPAGIDVTPPSVALFGELFLDWIFMEAWSNRAVPLTIVADDGPLGSGVAQVETSKDDGVTWTVGAHPVVPAPADHSNDGLNLVLFRAVDLAGNVALPDSSVVAIDTAGPSTEAWGPAGAVPRGAYTSIRFKIQDLTGEVYSQLVVESVSSGQVVKTVALGRRDAETSLWPSDATDYKWLRCTMAPGTYRVLVAGTTHDAAGNLWETAVCRRTLRVK